MKNNRKISGCFVIIIGILMMLFLASCDDSPSDSQINQDVRSILSEAGVNLAIDNVNIERKNIDENDDATVPVIVYLSDDDYSFAVSLSLKYSKNNGWECFDHDFFDNPILLSVKHEMITEEDAKKCLLDEKASIYSNINLLEKGYANKSEIDGTDEFDAPYFIFEVENADSNSSQKKTVTVSYKAESSGYEVKWIPSIDGKEIETSEKSTTALPAQLQALEKEMEEDVKNTKNALSKELKKWKKLTEPIHTYDQYLDKKDRVDAISDTVVNAHTKYKNKLYQQSWKYANTIMELDESNIGKAKLFENMKESTNNAYQKVDDYITDEILPDIDDYYDYFKNTILPDAQKTMSQDEWEIVSALANLESTSINHALTNAGLYFTKTVTYFCGDISTDLMNNDLEKANQEMTELKSEIKDFL